MLLAFLLFTLLSPSLSFASCPDGWMEADGCFKFLPEETGLSWKGAIYACEQVKHILYLKNQMVDIVPQTKI
jgi:hypothetical protein